MPAVRPVWGDVRIIFQGSPRRSVRGVPVQITGDAAVETTGTHRMRKIRTRTAATVEEKRDFSLRKPTASQERSGKKKHRLAPFEMTAGWGGAFAGAKREEKASACSVRNDELGLLVCTERQGCAGKEGQV